MPARLTIWMGSTENHVMALADLVQQTRDFLGRVLGICVQREITSPRAWSSPAKGAAC